MTFDHWIKKQGRLPAVVVSACRMAWEAAQKEATLQQPGNREVWVVFDQDGNPDYCAGYAMACHDHINDAVGEQFEGAEKWTVRRAVVVDDDPR